MDRACYPGPSRHLLYRVVFTRNSSFVKLVSSFPPLVFLGNISAPAFLIHHPVIRYLVRYAPVLNSDFRHRVILGLIALSITILLSKLWLLGAVLVKKDGKPGTGDLRGSFEMKGYLRLQSRLFGY